MNGFKLSVPYEIKYAGAALGRRCLLAGLMVAALAALSGCGAKDKKPGQALASVDGEEVTVLQLNEELQRAAVPAERLQQASKQLLDSLIDRQLLLNAAVKEKLDRDPKVVEAIERAKALIVAQIYMQKHIGNPAKPTRQEVDDYYNQHPQFFQQRKQFDMRQLALATKDVDAALKSTIDASKSLEEVATVLDSRKIRYARADLVRNTGDLPPDLSAKLLGLGKGQLFIVREGDRSLLISIADIKDTPMSEELAAPQIEQFLLNKKNKDAADAELARLRAGAKIEYLNKAATDVPPPAAPPASAASAASDAAATARGVAGLK